ncbi:MAG: IS1595 family transposase [Rhodospirillaceae bacterium]|nr:IS1595 family transposase [Rhodospirillaceae bacterium]
MSKKAPGKSHRRGLTLLQIADMFPTEDKAREWIESVRWPKGPYCPKCGSFNVQDDVKHDSMTHRCRDCKGKPFFTLRSGTVMARTKMSYREWAVGIYLFTTNIKGVSSMRLHRELGIGQKAAWFMLHRLRYAFEEAPDQFGGPVEIDETHVGGKRKNKPLAKRKELTGRGPVDMTAVAGAKDRETNRVAARVVENTDAPTLKGFVREHVRPGATIYTDEAAAYRGMPEFRHEAVNHSVSEYVRDMISTNGMESFWAGLKRGQAIYHKMSPKHLDRYVQEFAGRHNARDADTIDQMTGIVAGMVGKRLRYRDLIADNGLDSGARS